MAVNLRLINLINDVEQLNESVNAINTALGTIQNELTAGTNISIVDSVVSCELTGSTNIDITDGVISTTGLQNELTSRTNITITYNVVSCDLTGSTNIDITDGVISATGLQETITGGTNITITDNVVSCDLTGSTNIDITDGVISATGLATTTQLDNKYDDTGGAISGGFQISGTLAPNGNIFTSNRLLIQAGNTLEIQDDTEVKLSSGVVDIVLDGDDESINLNGYTQLNGSLNVLADEAIYLNEAGGTDFKTINYFNYNKLTEDVEGKQDTITPSTDLSCNSLNTNQLIVNDDLYFDTIVLRRPTGITGVTDEYAINLYELQCWVNNTNTLYDNSSNLVSYFAYWTDKEDEVAPSIAPSALYDNDISKSGRIGSSAESRDDLVVIIKNVPKTSIQQIQSLVVYSRTSSQTTKIE